jgi:hypothetical protein
VLPDHHPDIAYAEAGDAQDPDDPLVYVNHGTHRPRHHRPRDSTSGLARQVLAIAATPSDVPVSVNPWSFTAERG